MKNIFSMEKSWSETQNIASPMFVIKYKRNNLECLSEKEWEPSCV